MQPFSIRSERHGEYPFTTEESYERKRRRQSARLTQLTETLCHPLPEVLHTLQQIELEALIKQAHLTPLQHRVLRLFLDGYTYSEIGKQLGVSKQAIGKTLHFAFRKLRKASLHNPYVGLMEVYRDAIRRR